MKNSSCITASLLATLMATSAYADKLQCPAIDNVREASLVQVFEWGDEWLVFSSPISDEGGLNWTVAAGFKKRHAPDAQKAIDYANQKLKTADMVYPEPQKRGKDHECWYANNSLITVVAIDTVMFSGSTFVK